MKLRENKFGHRWTRIHTDKTGVFLLIRVNPCPSVANKDLL